MKKTENDGAFTPEGMIKTDRIINISILLAAFLAVVIFIITGSDQGIRYKETENPGLYEIDEDYPGCSVEEYYSGIGRKLRRISFTLPDDPGLKSEYVYSWVEHAYLRMYLNDEFSYERKEAEDQRIGRTPGCYFGVQPLRDAAPGDKVTVEVMSVYDDASVKTEKIYIATTYRLIEYLLTRQWPRLFMGMICMIAGLIFVLFSRRIRFDERESGSLFFLGLFTVVFGLWGITDVPLVSMFFGSTSKLTCYLNLISLLFLPALFIRFLRELYGNDIIYSILLSVNAGEILIVLLLQLLGICDVRECLLFTNSILVISAVIIILKAIYAIPKRHLTGEALFYTVYFLTICVTCVLDVIRYYLAESTVNLNVTMVLIIVYILLRGLNAVKSALLQHEEVLEKEKLLNEQRTAIMMSQMRPHFVFNTMNAISNLCDEDAGQAKQAIHDFSRYLRTNFESMEKKELVSFKDELTHAQFYLKIELLRFGDDLAVEYDIECTDFSLPPLTVQPLVENAVRHGIRKSGNPGTVKIISEEMPDKYVVRIEDDGIGFDVNEFENEEGAQHLGIRNVRERLKSMCGGRLYINSVPGEGTTVVIEVDKKN